MNKLLVFQTDFGLNDGAVSAMEGVCFSVDRDLNIRHLTHNITPYNIFEASYRLYQAIGYWPEDTTFVSVVDPGVGSDRKSIVARTFNDQYIVTPDNGTLTHTAQHIGIREVRQIHEETNRLENSELSHTFHGRDVYAYTAARLASDKIGFEEVGEKMNVEDIVHLDLFGFKQIENGILGQIDVLDIRFGHLWTSIPYEEFRNHGFELGDEILVEIFHDDKKVYSHRIKYVRSFSDVDIMEPLVYMNSVYTMAIALNQQSFSETYNIGSGQGWTVAFIR